MGYFPPNPLVLLPIEYLWLRLLANVPGLWKMQTIGKTGWKTPKELLHESAALSYQEAQTGNKAHSCCKAYTRIYPPLLLNVCIATTTVQLVDIFFTACLIIVHFLNSYMGNCGKEDWLGCMYSDCYTHVALLSFNVVSIVCIALGAENTQG